MSAFKAYDIRGIWGKDIDEELCYRAGFFIPRLLGADKVVVGHDARTSSDKARDALVRGITDSGADVLDLGLSTTPMVYYATVFLGVGASVQITASHNPPEYNGLKISRKGALPVGEDTGLKELERLCREEKIIPAKEKGTVQDASYMKEKYISFLRENSEDCSSLGISVDCSNGMAALLVKDVLPSASYINDTLDGTFPAHEPNPLDERNCEMIKQKTVSDSSDVGIIYDGDADRVIFIDEKGRFIQPDYIIAVLGLYYREKGLTGNALQDIRTSKSTTEFLEKLGYDVHIWRVGRAFATMKLREIDGVFGGELAGHYYMSDFNFSDSGILASLHVLSVVKRIIAEGRTLSSLVDSIIRYSNSGELNFRLERKDDAIKALYDRFAPGSSRILDFDGYRIEYPSWWFNVRKSNTEPYLRVIAEAENDGLLEEKLSEIRKIIGRFC